VKQGSSVTHPSRVWVGDEIAREYHHDEMPEYGVFPPELYVEALDREEVPAIMKYKSKKLGGQLSGGHGIGNGRLEFLEDFVGPRMIQLYKSVKLAFDDRLILNPGKMIEFNK